MTRPAPFRLVPLLLLLCSPLPALAKTPAAGAAPGLAQVQRTQAESLLGQKVLDTKGDAVGHIVDVLITAQGEPNAAVIDFSGFLGVGDRKIAVAWDALDFAVKSGQITITVTLDAAKLKALPVYTPAAPSVPVATRPDAPPPAPASAPASQSTQETAGKEPAPTPAAATQGKPKPNPAP